MRKRTRAEWVSLLRAVKLPCGPERDYAEVTSDADLHARGMLYHLPQGNGDSLQVAMPLQFATMPRVMPQSPAALPASESKR